MARLSPYETFPRRRPPGRLSVLFIPLLIAASGGTASADPLQLGKNTIDGGGASPTSSGTFVLAGTVGQHDAGAGAAGTFGLVGGFWGGGAGPTSGAEESPADPETQVMPRRIQVYPVCPNPTGGEMHVRFDTPSLAFARVRVYDLNGALVRTLIAKEVQAGRHSAVWAGDEENGRRASAGLYFVRIELGAYRGTQKVVVVR
jgi:hypothetical protein